MAAGVMVLTSSFPADNARLKLSGPPPALTRRIVAGAWTNQDMDAADEFAETETPADYSVNVLTIPVGTTITWSNNDPGMIHTVTSVDGVFDSGFLNEGDTWSYTFEEPGEFEYLCTPHPWMRAKVVVEA